MLRASLLVVLALASSAALGAHRWQTPRKGVKDNFYAGSWVTGRGSGLPDDNFQRKNTGWR